MAYRQSKIYLDFCLTKKFLEEEYIKNKKSTVIIAKGVKCCSDTVIKYLKKHNIKLRTLSEARRIKYWEFDIISPKLTKEILYEEYTVKKNNFKTIADKYNISRVSVFRRLKYYNIKTGGYNHKGVLNTMYGKHHTKKPKIKCV